MTRLPKILMDGVFLGAFFILASLIIAKLDLGHEVELRGPFYAIDGDTLAAGGERLRLVGIDAPEADQTCGGDGKSQWRCGDAAREALSVFATDPTISCGGDARDRYGRILVQCHRGALDVNAELVKQGMAVAAGNYAGEESAARDAGTGIWAGPFETPKAWRASRGRPEEQESGGGRFPAWLADLWS
ncbi:Endonuclease YncB, thermonuclease family [Rhizobium sp. NFR07]|uniref:thermonuclease family protein n=1 Tax=Rhizobium sp. NFR07 TaxID=1566262 RepID=UPI0008F029AD|nr:thermonuclease family protein [Rhizobium sp. NFR07]SFB39551.1 Endonuclease YncB, thermonuclease family [Rhizobium sp. NFR07]